MNNSLWYLRKVMCCVFLGGLSVIAVGVLAWLQISGKIVLRKVQYDPWIPEETLPVPTPACPLITPYNTQWGCESCSNAIARCNDCTIQLEETAYKIFDYNTLEFTNTYIGCNQCSEDVFNEEQLFETYGDNLYEYEWFLNDKKECWTKEFLD